MDCDPGVSFALDAETIDKSKPAENSPLNIERIPPEILGRIFQFIVITKTCDPDFAGIKPDSCKFLLVSRHWYRVARRTPELWTSWGNSLEDWKRWYPRSETLTLDLVLFDPGSTFLSGPLDAALQGAVRDCARRDVIRKVHLESTSKELLSSILLSLTPEDETIRHSSIESIVLRSRVDSSNLFARCRFPKLRNLSLLKCPAATLASLKFNTTTLVSLTLYDDIPFSPSTLTTSHLISLLASNPRIQTLKLWLFLATEKRDSTNRVPLHHLKKLHLGGGFHHISSFLDRLQLPTVVHDSSFDVSSCTPEGVKEFIGSYVRDSLRPDEGFRDGLKVSLSSFGLHISFLVAGVESHDSDHRPQHGDGPRFYFSGFISPWKKLSIELLAVLPQSKIVCFEIDTPHVQDMVVAMPNLRSLDLKYVRVLDGFLRPKSDSGGHKEILPFLKHLYLEGVRAERGNWDPLILYLTEQSRGGQLVSLNVFGMGAHICPEALKRIEPLVEKFIYRPDLGQKCPVGCGQT